MDIVKSLLELFRDLGVFGIAVFFIQNLIVKSTDRKFESYRAELNFQNYKSTQIYERQLNTFIDLHKMISKLNNKLMILTSFIQVRPKDAVEADIEERKDIEEVAMLYDKFLSFFQENIIFIPKSTVLKINNLIDDYKENINVLIIEKSDGTNSEYQKAVVSAGKKIRSNIPPALDQLIQDFQSLIGIEDSNNNLG